MRRLVVLAGIAAAAAVVASGAGAITAPPVKFTDPTGDSGTAPDIATVAVTNDEHGQYTFTIGFATPYTGSDEVALFLDTDKNFSTGDPNSLGADYLFIDDFGSHSFDFASWQSNDWAEASHATAGVVVSSDGKSVTMTVNKSDLGGSAGTSYGNAIFWLRAAGNVARNYRFPYRNRSLHSGRFGATALACILRRNCDQPICFFAARSRTLPGYNNRGPNYRAPVRRRRGAHRHLLAGSLPALRPAPR